MKARVHLKIISVAVAISAVSVANADQVTVAIPKTQIAIQSREFEPIEKPLVPMRAEVFASSFMPSSMTLPSRVDETSKFARSGLPAMGLSVLSRNFADTGLLSQVSARFGASALHMRRTARMVYLGTVGQFEQDAYLLPLEAGLVFSPRSLAANLSSIHFEPYFEASVLPTAVLTSRSVMDDGESYAALMGRARAGMVTSLAQTPWAVNLAVDQTVGSIQGASVSQTAFTLGIRAALE